MSQSLIDAVPATVGDSCADLTEPSPALTGGLVAAVECFGPAEGVDFVQLFAYDSSASLASAALAVQDLEQSTCTDLGWSAWTDGDGVERGVLGCYYGDGGKAVAFWTYDADAVLVVAWDEDAQMYVHDIHAWWQGAAPALAFN